MKHVLHFLLTVNFSIVQAQDCFLDSSFGIGGRAVYSLQNTWFENARTAIQPDGKIILFTRSNYTSGHNSSNVTCVLLRYTTAGHLDSSFNSYGKVEFTVSPGGGHAAEEVVIQPDGKILVVGLAYNPSAFFVARFNNNGTADNSFGVNGKVIIQAFGNLKDIKVQSDGKIVLAGSSYIPNTVYDEAITLFRMNSDGSMDSAFGNKGKVRLHLGPYVTTIGGQAFNTYYREMASSLALQSDGKLVVASVSYGANCRPEHDEYGWIYLHCDPILALTRFWPDGRTDSSFGLDGTITDASLHPALYWEKGDLYHQKLIDLALQPDDKIVVTTQSFDHSAFVVNRYKKNGTLDESFGTGGKAVIPLTGQSSNAVYSNSLALLPDGKILVAGGLGLLTSSQIAVMRLNNNGTLDQVLPTSGKAFFSLASSNLSSGPAYNYPRKISLFGPQALIAGNVSWYTGGSWQSAAGFIRLNAGFNALPVPVSASGATTLCNGDSVLLQTTASGTWQWKKDGLPINGANGPMFTVREQGSYSVSTSTGSLCGESEPVTVQFLARVQKPSLFINGSRFLCRDQTVTLSISNNIYNSVQWYKDGVIINGANQTNYATGTAGTYKVLVSDPYHCGTAFSDSVVVQVRDFPPTPSIDSSGPLTICEGERLVLSTAASGNLQWHLNQVPVPGATSSYYHPKQSGSYTVSAASEWCASYSSPVEVNVTPLPQPVIYQNGNTISVANIYSAYQWYVDSVPISGATEYQYQPARCGQYTVLVRNGTCNISSEPNSIILSKPVPVITWDGTVLSVPNQYRSYQWYFDDVAIAGATAAQLKPDLLGKYSVRVTSADYCTGVSDEFNLRVAITDLKLGDVQLNVYPNPAAEYVNVELDNAIVRIVNAALYDANGRRVLKQRLSKGINKIKLQSLASGLYILAISDESKEVKVKLMVAK